MMTKTITGLGVASLVLATNYEQLNVMCVEGFCKGTADTQYFIQLHRASTPTSTVAVPVRSWQVIGQNGFTFDQRPNGLQAGNLANTVDTGMLYLFLSSTDAVYTAVADGAVLDVNVDIEEYNLESGRYSNTATGATIAGVKLIFADPNANLKLSKLTVTETAGAASYVQLFSKAPALNAVPIMQWPLAVNATQVWNFGVSAGVNFTTSGADGIVHSGMYVGVSLTSGAFDTAGAATVTGVYRGV